MCSSFQDCIDLVAFYTRHVDLIEFAEFAVQDRLNGLLAGGIPETLGLADEA